MNGDSDFEKVDIEPVAYDIEMIRTEVQSKVARITGVVYGFILGGLSQILSIQNTVSIEVGAAVGLSLGWFLGHIVDDFHKTFK